MENKDEILHKERPTTPTTEKRTLTHEKQG